MAKSPTSAIQSTPSDVIASADVYDTRTLTLNRVSWSGVLAGAAIALTAQLILNMFGLGVGAATLDPIAGDNPTASAFSITTAIWWTISGIVAAYLGGYTAGRLSGQPAAATSGWNGLVSWAVSILIITYLLTSAVGGLLGGALSALGSSAKATIEAAAPMVGADPFSSIEQEVRQRIGDQGAQAAGDSAVAAVRAAITGDPAQAEQARENAAQALASARGMSVDDARRQVAEYETRYRQVTDQAKERAKQAADSASRVASTGGLFGAFALLLGALAAWFGGRAGSVDPIVANAGVTVRREAVR